MVSASAQRKQTTCAEAQSAWRQFRNAAPWRQPTVSPMAGAPGIARKSGAVLLRLSGGACRRSRGGLFRKPQGTNPQGAGRGARSPRLPRTAGENKEARVGILGRESRPSINLGILRASGPH